MEEGSIQNLKDCELYEVFDLMELCKLSEAKVTERIPPEYLGKPFNGTLRPDIAERIEKVRASAGK